MNEWTNENRTKTVFRRFSEERKALAQGKQGEGRATVDAFFPGRQTWLALLDHERARLAFKHPSSGRKHELPPGILTSSSMAVCLPVCLPLPKATVLIFKGIDSLID